VYGVVGGKGYGRALALGGATATGAAVILAGTAIPTFYAVAAGTIVALVLRLLLRSRDPGARHQPLAPGALPLILLAVWATIVTLLAPSLFNGIPVIAPNSKVGTLVDGTFTTSNLAQIIYLVLGVCVVLYLAGSGHTGPELIGLAAGLTTVLSFWRFLSVTFGLPFPEGVFDNSPSFSFIETAPGGIARFRGILSEPSGLAISSLVTVSYMLSRAVRVIGWRRWGAIVVAGMAGFLASISTSGTFVIASVIVLSLAGLSFLVRFLLQRGTLKPIVVLVGCAAAIAALWVVPLIVAFVQVTINDKVASSSFDERSAADARSYSIVFETFGFGVGLGSHRPSSFAAGLLSTTGVIGTVLFAAAVVILIVRTWSLLEYRPVIWALVALLVTKIIASPDLADTSGILWISLGILAHGSLHRLTQQTAVGFEAPHRLGAYAG